MKHLRALLTRLSGLFTIRRREREISDELHSHLELHIADNLRAGMSPAEARRAALIKLGGFVATQEAIRDRSTVPLIENTAQDIRFATRQLRKNPTFAVTAIAVTAMAVCSSVAIFSFVDAALLKPLPYKNPATLFAVDESSKAFPHSNLSYFDYLDWKRLNTVFSSLEVYTGSGYLLHTDQGVEPVKAAKVSDGFFNTLGIVPVLGRTFHSGEDLPAAPQTVLLTYSCWQKRFAGRRDIVSSKLLLSGEPFTIIGVLPADFQFAPRGEAEFWTTLHASSGCETHRSCHNLDGIARLKPGADLPTAFAQTKLIAAQLEKQYPDSNRGQSADVLPLSDFIIGQVRPMIVTLLASVTLLLFIALLNVSSLLLVRTESRRREMAVRSSLGASRARLLCQFIAEGSLLAGLGAFIGLLSARVAVKFLLTLIPADLLAKVPFLIDAGLNARVLAFTSAIVLAAIALFAIAPVLRLPTVDTHGAMSDGGRWSAGLTWRRLGSRLIIFELATAVALLVGAGLLGKSFYRLLRVDLGFQPDHLASISVEAPISIDDKQQVLLGRKIVDALSTLPGVRNVALTTVLPVSFNGNTDWIRIVGKPYNGEHNEVNERDVSSEYFKTLHAKLLRGRFFSDAVDSSKKRVVVINHSLAQTYFPGEDPIGQLIGNTILKPDSLCEVIGVIADIREGSLDQEIWPAEYHPFNQDPNSYFSVIARTSQDEHSLLPALSAAIRKTYPAAGLMDEISFSDRIQSSPSAYLHRSATWLVGAFAASALLLAIIGLYGVVAYSVNQRTREIGVRMALGAETVSVYRLVMTEAAFLAAIGIAVGLLASLAATRALQQMLFGVQPWDPATLAAVALLLMFAAMLASFVPARKAASVNPVDALRAE